ncbi:hypothetical protein EX895_000101 [Sporisorium graminicola]|uniref:Uncharacterized protein n=1 Tax=Sporisorium graminicola TaxID=280036 RepID=A0A4U7KZ89_9BASI|nr:hypothetical protein EX895_000101 [Sporisorium graminicola]TKY90103.1 hypothetical protein EX895_000101 [Sporisorium graminicola]
MAPLANLLVVAAILAAPALAAVASPNLAVRQYQDPNSELVINNPACDFYQCIIYWVPGTQVAVNWVNPPSSGDVQIDLMTNNDTDVVYNVGTAPSISNTCDAGAGFGQPGPNGAQCGGFVFTVPSSWNAGNYSSLRAMSMANQEVRSYTDKIYITHNSSTSNNVALSIVSGSTVGGGSASSTAASSSTSTAGAGATTAKSSGSASATSTGASASRSSSTASRTSSGSGASSTGSPNSGALAGVSASSAAFSLAAVLTVGLGTLL